MLPFWSILAIIGTFALSIIFTDIVRFFALKFGIIDKPDGERKRHRQPIPWLGGLAIFSSFSLVVLTILFVTDHFTAGQITNRHILGFILGGFILMVGGILDDKYHLSAKKAFIFPVLASLIAVFSGIGVEKITNPFGDPFVIGQFASSFFTFIWILCVIYTTKILDGLDGLVSGIGTIAMLLIAALALSISFYQPDVALLALLAAAALIGFLFWNFHPAQIFLGEGGSTFIGYLIGVLAIIAGSKVATALLIIGVPALDLALVLIDRKRSGVSLFSGDRRHLHFKLIDSGFSHRKAVLFYYAIAFIFGLTTLIFTSWQKVVALLVLGVLTIGISIYLSKTQKHL